MKIKYIKEILLFFNSFLDIEIDENKPDELIIYNKPELYEITEILTELNISHDIKKEYYDYIILKINLIDNKESIDSYYELELNKSEIKLHDKLYKKYDEIESLKYPDKLHLISRNEFYENHKNYFSFNLNYSSSDASEILSELISDNKSLNSKYEIFSDLDELYDEYSDKYDLYKYRNYNICISDESNIIIDKNKHNITNISENIFKYLLTEILISKFYISDENSDELLLDESKSDELIDLFNIFSENNSYEIFNNTESNLKYASNKLFMPLNSFKYYSNESDYFIIYYNKSNENKSINKSDLIELNLISDIIDSIEYYDSDSYEIREFLKILELV